MLETILILLRLSLLLPVSAVAQNTHATRTPIRVISTAPIDAREIDLLRFDFQELYYGFEGPNYIRMKGEPQAGEEVIAEAQLFRPEAVSSARFEFINASGQELGRQFFTKTSGNVFDGAFVGVVKVPNEPFKVRVSGVDINGKPYQCTYLRLFRPVKGRSAAPRLPAGMSREQAISLNRMIQAHDQQSRAKLVERARRHPDGTITLPRAEVSEATYEPLISNAGNVIGLRVRYAVRVSQDGHYAFAPSVWPIYADANSRGKIEMNTIALSVDPLPEGLNPQAAALHLRYGGGASYKAGTTYRFTADTVPNFAIQNAQKTRFCIMQSTSKSSPAMETTWRTLVNNNRPVPYAMNIGWTTFKGRTDSFSGPSVFYQSFIKEGAQKCSAGGNINF